MDGNDNGFDTRDEPTQYRHTQPTTNSEGIMYPTQLPHGQAGWLSHIHPTPLEQFPEAANIHEDFIQHPMIDLQDSFRPPRAHDAVLPGPLLRSHSPSSIPRYDPSVSPRISHQPMNGSRSVYPDLDSSFIPWSGRYDAGYPATSDVDAVDTSDVDEMSVDEQAAPVTARPVRRTRTSKAQLKNTRALKQLPRPEKRRGRKKGEKRGPREVLDPGKEFNTLHAQATEAFLDKKDYDTAIQCILQAISINPEIYSAHVLLSEIYFSQGESDKAIAALFSGAHAAPNDPNVWHQLADACLQKSTSPREDILKQATYCYSRVLGIDQKDTEARLKKAAISRELGYYAKALKDLDVLQKAMPYDTNVLRDIAEVCLDMGDVSRARYLYEEALEERRSGRSDDEKVFTWDDLLVYVDLVSTADGVEVATQTLKDISRWLVGRTEEWFWNSSTDDDREWDADHEPRRSQVSGFQIGRYPLELYGAALPLDLRIKLGCLRLTEGKMREALVHFEWLEPDVRGEESNVYHLPDLFLQAADSLRTFKQFHQAHRYYLALHSINAYDDSEFWLGIGACAYVCGAKEDALMYYENAKTADPQSAEAFTQLSKLYADRGERAKAMQSARTALKLYEDTVSKSQKRKYERRETREAREEAQAAFRRAYMLSPPPGEPRNPGPVPSFSRRAREKRRWAEREIQQKEIDHQDHITPQDRRDRAPRVLSKRSTAKSQRTGDQQEASIRQTYARLRSHTLAMRTGDEESKSAWLECAENLVEEFRSMKSFYPAERYKTFQGYESGLYSKRNLGGPNMNIPELGAEQEDFPMPSIENTIPNDYCGIKFSCWLDIFLEYAIVLANLQYERSECYTVINAAQDCTIWYHDTTAMTQIYTCYIVCALALHDEATLFGTALRWLMREYAFCSDVYRLFGALNFHYPHTADKGGKAASMSNAKFRVPPNQKFLFRHLVSLDAQLPEDYGVDTPYGPVPAFMRKERHEVGLGQFKSQVNNISTAAADLGELVPDLSWSAIGTPSRSAPIVPENRISDQGVTTTSLVKPIEMQIQLLVLYGQILYAGGSFPNALSYFYRAMSLSPRNPVLLLTMALCYLHQMMKRQCENRHTYFLQGLALFEQYAETRLSWAEKKETSRRNSVVAVAQGAKEEDLTGLTDLVRREISFNRARCWQMVGMSDLAIRGYARMMELRPIKLEKGENERKEKEDDDDHNHEIQQARHIEVAMDGDVDNVESHPNQKAQTGDRQKYSMEAAYSMVVMYASNGDVETARSITEKYLVVD